MNVHDEATRDQARAAGVQLLQLLTSLNERLAGIEQRLNSLDNTMQVHAQVLAEGVKLSGVTAGQDFISSVFGALNEKPKRRARRR